MSHGQQLCEILILSRPDKGGKKLWPGHDVNKRTDKQTEGQTDRQISIYPKLCLRGINTPKRKMMQVKVTQRHYKNARLHWYSGVN